MSRTTIESSARPIPSHTVARGHLDEDESFFTGMTNGLLVTVIFRRR